jgi:hypothetical protein
MVMVMNRLVWTVIVVVLNMVAANAQIITPSGNSTGQLLPSKLIINNAQPNTYSDSYTNPSNIYDTIGRAIERRKNQFMDGRVYDPSLSPVPVGNITEQQFQNNSSNSNLNNTNSYRTERDIFKR